MLKRSLFALSVLVVVGLVACNGGGGNTIVTPTPGPTCAPGTTVQLVYPIPGATGVPDSPQQIVFAAASPLPASYNAVLNNANTLNGNQAYTAATVKVIAASQVPTPSATPSFANPTYESVTLLSGFTSAQTIYVWLNDTANNCTPLGPVGSFTTQ